mgnify:CR=1 FL=1
MDALVGQDGRVYLGRQENYFPSVEDGVPSYYDNSDNSLQLVSDNAKIFHSSTPRFTSGMVVRASGK